LKKTKITVVGSGYVGLSMSALLAQYNQITLLDIDAKRVKKINKKQSPIIDADIESFFKRDDIEILATIDKNKAYKNAEYIIIATPTNYDPVTNKFDTKSVESVIGDILKINPKATLVVKSTVPVGFTDMIKKNVKIKKIIFVPEFLREGYALYDNLYPSRIVIGDKSEEAKIFARILIEGARKPSSEIKVLYTNSNEAEAIKLFSNTYLAMRIAFFNELDSYCESFSLSTREIIKGVCSDNRIGDMYNNPSFGYGGYCLPKDTKQLLANFRDIPNEIIYAIVKSNSTRKDFIVSSIMSRNPKKIGIYRLIMKQGSDNYRESASLSVINRLKKFNVDIYIYEPTIESDKFFDHVVINDLDEFKNNSDIIIANRVHPDLNDVLEKVYSRDLFGKD
tara:strand:+ start:28 stop:1209 length:1182 start_codon:yes stop_codon:yes gene_type:complete